MSKFTSEGNKIDFHCRFCGTWSPFSKCCDAGDKADSEEWEALTTKPEQSEDSTPLTELNEFFK